MYPEQFKLLFEPELLKEIEDIARIQEVRANDIILNIGQTVKSMPIIISGSLRVTRISEEGKEILLYYVYANESCAMTFTCCMEQQASEIRAIAEEDSILLNIPVSVMDKWIVKYPTWKNFVMSTMRFRFNELLRTIDQIAFQKLDERLIHYLKEKSKVSGSTVLNVSHEQVALDLATSRVVISRLLKKMENDEQILLYRTQIKLLNKFFEF